MKIVKTTILLSIMLLFLGLNSAKACEIEFEIQGEKKEIYEVGDIVIVKIIVTFTHKVCPEGIEKTKYEKDGVKILKATKWKETSSNVWERKLKIEITGNESGKLELSAVRTCDEEGGLGKISFVCKPLEKLEAKTEVKSEDE
ncbi:MAG: hypothetical protein U9R19_10235 [Bacteroidota bacterium]|nr:hypothetical protein [Bacteroidota bacterium]